MTLPMQEMNSSLQLSHINTQTYKGDSFCGDQSHHLLLQMSTSVVMNLNNQFLLLISVMVALHFTSAAGSKEHGLHKRNYLTEEQSVICFSILSTEYCTNGYNQEYADIGRQCNQGIYMDLEEDCAVNAMGDICNSVIIAVISDSQLLLVCGGRFPTTCTPECRHLLTTIRSELGCCANKFYDNYLWTLCDVGFVAEQCESTINSSQTQQDPNCTDESFNQQIFRNVFCRRQYFESAINVTPDFCGIEHTCEANEEGRYCLAIPELETDPLERAVSCACTDTCVCDPLCIEALNNGTNALGCCFISRFNDTEQHDWLAFEFWQQCDLTSPGFCEPSYNDAASGKGVDLDKSTMGEDLPALCYFLCLL